MFLNILKRIIKNVDFKKIKDTQIDNDFFKRLNNKLNFSLYILESIFKTENFLLAFLLAGQ